MSITRRSLLKFGALGSAFAFLKRLSFGQNIGSSDFISDNDILSYINDRYFNDTLVEFSACLEGEVYELSNNAYSLGKHSSIGWTKASIHCFLKDINNRTTEQWKCIKIVRGTPVVVDNNLYTFPFETIYYVKLSNGWKKANIVLRRSWMYDQVVLAHPI